MKNTAIKSTKLAQAEILGTMAFNSGKKRMPCDDNELLKLCDGPVGSSIPLIKAWLYNWDLSNLRKK